VSVIRWEDPPSPGRRSAAPRFDSHAVAVALKAQPGRWAVVIENPPSVCMATYITSARASAFAPAGSFQARSRRIDGVQVIYARFLPGTVRRG
jgi:hypothetical protein